MYPEADPGKADYRHDPGGSDVSVAARPDGAVLGQTQVDDRRQQGVAARKSVPGCRRRGLVQRVDRLRERLGCHERTLRPRQREDVFQCRDERQAGQQYSEDGGDPVPVVGLQPVAGSDEHPEEPHVAELGHQPEYDDGPLRATSRNASNQPIPRVILTLRTRTHISDSARPDGRLRERPPIGVVHSPRTVTRTRENPHFRVTCRSSRRAIARRTRDPNE